MFLLSVKLLLRELVPKLKQSLNTIMTKSSVALLNNASIDNMQNVEKEQGQVWRGIFFPVFVKQ